MKLCFKNGNWNLTDNDGQTIDGILTLKIEADANQNRGIPHVTMTKLADEDEIFLEGILVDPKILEILKEKEIDITKYMI